MNRTHRSRALGLAAAAASLSLFLPLGASAQGTVGSSNDPGTKPPAPSACSGYLWSQNVMAEDAQVLSKSHPRIKVEGLTKPAGTVDVPEAITWDARTHKDDKDDKDDDQGENKHVGEELSAVHDNSDEQGEDKGHDHLNDVEKFEKMRVEFWKNGQLLAATPGFTPDLPDDAIFAWSVSSLGSVDLWQDADAVYLVHASQWMTTDAKENAFFPRSVCFKWSPFVAAPVASIVWDCNNATLTKTNNGKAPAVFHVTVNGVTGEITLGPGQTYQHVIPLKEDTTTHVVVEVNGQVILDKTITTDCVPNATTTVPPTTVPPTTVPPTTVPPTTVPPATVPPTTVTPAVETQVMAETATQDAALAFTGDHTAIGAGIGAGLLTLGAALLGIGRRKRAQA